MKPSTADLLWSLIEGDEGLWPAFNAVMSELEYPELLTKSQLGDFLFEWGKALAKSEKP